MTKKKQVTREETAPLYTGHVIKLDRGYPLVRITGCCDESTKEQNDLPRELRCEHATALVKRKTDRAVIGDRVELSIPAGHDKGIIERILPRTTTFVRKDPTERALPQTLAANFDLVLVAQPIEEINLRRLERELVLAHESVDEVVVILTKADLIDNPAEINAIKEQIKGFIGQDRVMVLSGDDPSSVDAVAHLLAKEGGKTAILIGRSGVGKSSLVNMLVGSNIQETTPVRERDGKGRHTTTTREVIELPQGGAVIDMPGVRGLGLWDADEGIELAFSDVEALAQTCKFRDCTHHQEPGCAVRAAVNEGKLEPYRLESYLRLKEESAEVKARREVAERIRTRRGHPRRRQG